MKKLFISDITVSTGTFVEQFQIGGLERRLKKDGQVYLSLTLKDRTGKIDAKLWEIPSGFCAAEGDFVKVEAETGTYREEVQLAIRRIRTLAREEIELEDFLPASKRNREDMVSDLLTALMEVGTSHPGLREALLELVHDLGSALMNAPAAKSNHHAWLGGLVEHTLSLIGLAERVCQHYPELDRDILIAAAVLHDIGKLAELSCQTSLGYTRGGTLVGHCVLGIEIFGRYSAGLDEAIRDHLEHIIVSHHGQIDWGAVKLPMTREARIFHLLDMMDAKMAIINDALEGDTNASGFTSFVPALHTPLWNGHS